MVADLLRIISGDQALKSALPAAGDGRFFDSTNRVATTLTRGYD